MLNGQLLSVLRLTEMMQQNESRLEFQEDDKNVGFGVENPLYNDELVEDNFINA